MDQPPAVALTAFADAWPRAIETEIGAALCAIGAGRTLTFFDDLRNGKTFGASGVAHPHTPLKFSP